MRKSLIPLLLVVMVFYSCSCEERPGREDPVAFRDNKLTFKLENVPLAEEPLEETDYATVIKNISYELLEPQDGHFITDEQIAKVKLEASGFKRKEIISSHNHPFISALTYSFNDHRPLILSPDMIWLLICQGFGEHVNANAEELRDRFVDHPGQKTLVVKRHDFVKGHEANPWPEVFPLFSKQIKKYSNNDLYDILVANYSTTTQAEKTAYEMTFMYTNKFYFAYRFETWCGIPSITLEGTKEDWEKIL